MADPSRCIPCARPRHCRAQSHSPATRCEAHLQTHLVKPFAAHEGVSSCSIVNACTRLRRVALGSATVLGNMIFGKNSDRPADECQPLVLTPAATHQPIQDAGCQYVDVPQAAETCRVVGSKPWWCAGYEHGFNEHMVVIGNEGLPTKFQAAASSDTRLVGMEIVRIALERSRSAAEAVDVITSLVETHGQGKFGRPDPSAQRGALGNSYDNSFLVADPREAYVVECAGFDWAVRKVKSADRCWSISNVSNLSEQDLKVSATAQASAVTLAATVTAEPVAGGTVAGPGLQWTASFGDLKAARNGATRQARSAALLNALAPPSGPGVDALSMMLTLSDHGDSTTDTGFVVNIRPPGAVSLCVHNRHDLSNRGTTAASLVADFPKLGDDGSMERLPVYCAHENCMQRAADPVFVPIAG